MMFTDYQYLLLGVVYYSKSTLYLAKLQQILFKFNSIWQTCRWKSKQSRML